VDRIGTVAVRSGVVAHASQKRPLALAPPTSEPSENGRKPGRSSLIDGQKH
jgi:hypothetical protein